MGLWEVAMQRELPVTNDRYLDVDNGGLARYARRALCSISQSGGCQANDD